MLYFKALLEGLVELNRAAEKGSNQFLFADELSEEQIIKASKIAITIGPGYTGLYTH